MPAATVMPSPWWYRRRDAVIGMIYGISYGVGGAISSALSGGAYIPLYRRVAERWGESDVAWCFGLMLAAMAVCYALRVWGSSYLHARIVWSENARTDSLVIAGPFRYVRNPLYLGNLFMAIAFCGFATDAGAVLLIALTITFNMAMIRWEERGLRARFGAAFDAYCRAVPAMFPAFRPAPASVTAHPSWREGFRSELFVAALAVGLVALITLPMLYGWAVFGIAYAGGIAAQYRVAGRDRPAGQA